VLSNLGLPDLPGLLDDLRGEELDLAPMRR
jgi:hypothetical protein